HGDLGVGTGLAVGNGDKSAPEAALERGAMRVQRQQEIAALPGEVLAELSPDLGKRRLAWMVDGVRRRGGPGGGGRAEEAQRDERAACRGGDDCERGAAVAAGAARGVHLDQVPAAVVG